MKKKTKNKYITCSCGKMIERNVSGRCELCDLHKKKYGYYPFE